MEQFISQQAQAVAKDTSGNVSELSQNQRTTHHEILKFGNQIYEKKCMELEKLREQSLVELEQRIWALANEDKENAVKQAYEEGQKEIQQQKQIFKKEKEKAVKSECKRVEAYMTKQMTQKLQEASEEFELRLKEALHDARIQFEVEKMLAIRETREDEINKAVEEAAKMADVEEQARKKMKVEAEKEKKEALELLRSQMLEETEKAVQDTMKKCDEQTLEEIRKSEERHKVELGKLEQTISDMGQDYIDLKTQLAEKEKIVRKSEITLREIAQEFQQFIDMTKGFSKGQSDYLLPDINLLQYKLMNVVSSCENVFTTTELK